MLADAVRTAGVVAAIRGLGYEAIGGAEFYQWRRVLVVAGAPREVKLDLLVGPVGKLRSRLQGDARRLRPRGKRVGLHAHPTEEAIGIEDGPIAIPITGRRSDGYESHGTVYVPRAFTYLMMKLHAFDDRKDDAAKELGRHHAFDLYTIVGMMTEEEYELALEVGRGLAAEEHVRRSWSIVAESFSSLTALELLRIREHRQFAPDFDLEEFIAVLGDIFRTGPGAG